MSTLHNSKQILQPPSIALIRITVAVILLSHSIPSIISGDVNQFGRLYLNEIGFAPIGVALAWAIKLSHIAAAACLLLNRWIFYPALVSIIILVAGIVFVHAKDGWFVVGGGRNGIEYNVLLIVVLISIMLHNHAAKTNSKNSNLS